MEVLCRSLRKALEIDRRGRLAFGRPILVLLFQGAPTAMELERFARRGSFSAIIHAHLDGNHDRL